MLPGACVGIGDETQGANTKVIVFVFPQRVPLNRFNTKQTLHDKAKALACAAKAEKKMKPNQAAMRTPLKVSSD